MSDIKTPEDTSIMQIFTAEENQIETNNFRTTDDYRDIRTPREGDLLTSVRKANEMEDVEIFTPSGALNSMKLDGTPGCTPSKLNSTENDQFLLEIEKHGEVHLEDNAMNHDQWNQDVSQISSQDQWFDAKSQTSASVTNSFVNPGQFSQITLGYGSLSTNNTQSSNSIPISSSANTPHISGYESNNITSSRSLSGSLPKHHEILGTHDIDEENIANCQQQQQH
jgi:hypothetical protein